MRPKSLMLLVLALGCGLVASVGISQVMDRKPVQAPVGETQDVLVTVQDVTYGTPLTAEAVKLEKWPKDKVPAGALADVQKVTGRRARGKLFKGEPILEAKLLSAESGAGASTEIPAGFRVVSVKVDASTTGGSLVLPGDRVDVLVNVRANTGAGIMETSTKTILQDIRVFAVDQVYKVEAIEDQESAISAKTVSLLVTPSQAERIALAEELGKIRLAIRSPDDDEMGDAPGANASHLLSGSEKSDRDDESGKNTENKTDFVDWLTSKQKPNAEETPAPTGAVNPGWTMILLVGSEPKEVHFDGQSALPTVNSAGGGASGPAAPPANPLDAAAAGLPPAAPSDEPAAVPDGGAPNDDGSDAAAPAAPADGGSMNVW
ncbi:MAG: Flp pilus assembly protein CpaB [Pirellulales bacterium]